MVGRRAAWRCEYCLTRQDIAGYTFHLEHIVPVVAGGSHEAANRALACSPCNLAKGVRTAAPDPVSGQTVPLFDPRRDRWTRHFLADRETGRIHGRTACGRATIEALALNDPRRVVTRQLWLAVGWWP